MKNITLVETEKLFSEVGHQASISIPVKTQDTGEIEYKTLLNNAMVYNPITGGQIGMSSNIQNAATAMKFLKTDFRVYSSYFDWATGDYKIIK